MGKVRVAGYVASLEKAREEAGRGHPWGMGLTMSQRKAVTVIKARA
ncbi:hypothetical protein AB6813_21940 [bacterium RCC_150]